MPARKKKKEPEYPTSVRLRESTRTLLRADAAEQQRSVSWLIQQILENWQAYRLKQKKIQANKA